MENFQILDQNLVKNLKISHLFILGKIGKENLFDILLRKKVFLENKNIDFKKLKKMRFYKGKYKKSLF